jgi:hypothetical protein
LAFACAAADVVVLTDDNFNQVLDSKDTWLVEVRECTFGKLCLPWTEGF